MQETTNYKLKKQELTDKADITQISGNWDTIDTELANKLNTSGGTITGELTIKGPLNMESPIKTTKAEVLQTQVDVVKGVAPEATKYSYISMFDKNGWAIADNRLAHIDYMVGADGAATMLMSVNKFEQASGETPASLFVRYQADGTPRIFLSHNPKKESNSQDIATTGWVRQLAATTSEYGLVKLADTTAALLPTDPLATVNVPLLYELADYRRLNTAYFVGDRVACAFQYDLFLECTKAGVTSGNTLDTRNVTHGQVIEDGTVEWTVRTHVRTVNDNYADADGNIALSDVGGGSNFLVKKPTITAPTDGEQNVSTAPTITASAYGCVIPTETRLHREFQITTNTGSFASPVWSKQINADSVQVLGETNAVVLDDHLTYKLRCRDVTTNGLQSEWSDVVTFTVGEDVTVLAPTITCTSGTTDVPENPSFTTSAFTLSNAATSDTHLCTTWQLIDNLTTSVVWQSVNDAANKTSYTFAKGVLSPNKTYTIKAIHVGTIFGQSPAGSLEFTTKAQFDHIQTPTVTVEGEPASVGETPTITGSAFTVVSDTGASDTHVSTDWMLTKATTYAITEPNTLNAFGILGLGTLESRGADLKSIPTMRLSEVVWESINDTANKTSIVVPKGKLQTNTTYELLARYRGAALGYSDYASKQFTTKAQFGYIQTPVITSKGVFSSKTSNEVTLGAFTVIDGSDSHVSTDWELYDSGDELVWSSIDDATNLLKITIDYNVVQDETYTLKVRFKGSSLGYSDYATKDLALSDMFKLSGITTGVGAQFKLYKNIDGNFINVGHKGTDGATLYLTNLKSVLANIISTTGLKARVSSGAGTANVTFYNAYINAILSTWNFNTSEKSVTDSFLLKEGGYDYATYNRTYMSSNKIRNLIRIFIPEDNPAYDAEIYLIKDGVEVKGTLTIDNDIFITIDDVLGWNDNSWKYYNFSFKLKFE